MRKLLLTAIFFLLLIPLVKAQYTSIPEITKIYTSTSDFEFTGVYWEEGNYEYYLIAYEDTDSSTIFRLIEYDTVNGIISNYWNYDTNLEYQENFRGVTKKYTPDEVQILVTLSITTTTYKTFIFNLTFNGTHLSGKQVKYYDVSSLPFWYMNGLANFYQNNDTGFLVTTFRGSKINIEAGHGEGNSFTLPTTISKVFDAWAYYDSDCNMYYVFISAIHTSYPNDKNLYVLEYNPDFTYTGVTIILVPGFLNIYDTNTTYFIPYWANGHINLLIYNETGNNWFTLEGLFLDDVCHFHASSYREMYRPIFFEQIDKVDFPGGFKYWNVSHDLNADNSLRLRFDIYIGGSTTVTLKLDNITYICSNGTYVTDVLNIQKSLVTYIESYTYIWIDTKCPITHITYNGGIQSSISGYFNISVTLDDNISSSKYFDGHTFVTKTYYEDPTYTLIKGYTAPVGWVDAEISNLEISDEMVTQNKNVTIKICVRNTGNVSYNFPIGLTIGYGLQTSGYFSGEYCSANCYVDGLGDYVYTGTIAPGEEACVERIFNFKDTVFEVDKYYDLVVAVYTEEYQDISEALDWFGYREYFKVNDFEYLYRDTYTCDSGWGDLGTQMSCDIDIIEVPDFCPDGYVSFKPFIKYNFTYPDEWNNFTYWSTVGDFIVNIIEPSENLFDAYKYYLDSGVVGKIYDFHIVSNPNPYQRTRVIGYVDVYCNLLKNFTLEPSYLTWNMSYTESYSWLFRLYNNDTRDHWLTIRASDYRWMCVKDQQTQEFHTEPVTVFVPAGTTFDIAVTWSPSGVGPTGCEGMTGLPLDELDRWHRTYLKVHNNTENVSLYAIQDIYVGPYCNCTSWVKVGCYNSTHAYYTRTCNPPGCANEIWYVEDPTCAVYPPNYTITPPVQDPFTPVVNTTTWGNYRFLEVFVTPFGILTIVMIALGIVAEYYTKAHGVAFGLITVVLSLVYVVRGYYPLGIGIPIIIIAGFIVAYQMKKIFTGG